jgi:magnesium-transporting ATPase (P-type)
VPELDQNAGLDGHDTTPVPNETAETAWHASKTHEVFAAFRTGPDGLTTREAADRLAIHGPNRLPQGPRRSAFLRLLIQFHNLLIYVLLAAAALSAIMGHAIDAAVILAVVIVNACVGFIQEGRAERALEAIRRMIDPKAKVVRDGQRTSLAAEEIVPGDVVLVEAGDRIPADLRLTRARNLRIEEAVLTGESVAVDKSVAPVPTHAALGDRASMAFSGTLVAAGQGSGVAVSTGAKTELGRIGALVGAVETLKTPLVRQMDGFARQLTVATLSISAAAFLFAVFARQYATTDAFMAVVGLAVAAIPEGLPAVMTITLAIGVQRMAGRNAIVRRLPAVETLGSVSVICSDKTGTLTRNEMTVRSIVTACATFDVTGAGYEPDGAFRTGGCDVDPAGDPVLAEVVRAGLLCNEATLRRTDGVWRVDGDPMEGALVALAMKGGIDAELARKQLPRRDEIPFDAQHRFMASLHHSHEDAAFIVIKGAPERILQMCLRERTGRGDRPIDRDAWHGRVDELAARGQRVLAFATKAVAPGQQDLAFSDVQRDATLLGLMGLIDPPREEAIAAVEDCRRAGIRIVMITGDHAVTAQEIARQLGLADQPKVLTGQHLETMDEAALRRAAGETDVFARTTPEHKLRLVQALQADGFIVAMTGDGVNDAPALKRADVGVAMGDKGTEAAKQAAEMVLTDDNFASIVAAVREGRTVYDNLMKVIGWTLPTSGGEALTILAAIAFGFVLPVTPVQILWINMITAVTLGLTLAFEPTEPGTMRRPPRPPQEPILSRDLMWRIVFVSALFVMGAFGVFSWAQDRGLGIETSRTLVVNTIVVMEIFYLFSVRYVHGTSLTWRGVLGTRAVLIGVAAVVLGQFLFTYLPPMQTVFGTRPVAVLDGLAIVGVGVVLLLVVEAEKRIRGRLASTALTR